MKLGVPLWTVLKSREEFGGPDLPLLTVKSDSGVSMRDLAEGRQPSDDLAGYRRVMAGDLVVNKLWARFGAYGVAGIDGVISPAYWVLMVDRGRVAPGYLHHLLRSSLYLAEIARVSKDMPPNGFDLPWSQFRQIVVDLPPLDEQRRIADFLDTETARLDAVQLLRDEQLALLAGREAAALTEALDDPAVRRIRLGYLAKLQSGVTVGGSRPSDGLVERPYLRVANVKEDRLELDSVTTIRVTPEEARASRLRPGDVLMTEGGDLDKLGRGTVWRGEISGCLHQNHVFALRCDARLLPEYLSYFTRTAPARAYFAATGVKTTNLASTNSEKVRNLPVPLPSLATQRERVEQIERALRRSGNLRTFLDHQASLVAERRQALITAAVTGQLDVTTARGIDTR